jgi:alpha-1,2-mannosyltransferase
MNRLARFLASCKPIAPWAGGLMWVIWVVSSALGPGNLDRNGQVIGTDHTAFHTAALLIDEGRGIDVYDYPGLKVFAERQEELTGKSGFLDPFRNPPFYALLYLPTAHLQYLASYAVWAVLGLVCLVVGLYLVIGRRFFSAAGWSLTFYPVFAAVSFGQNTLLSFGVFALVYRLLVNQQRFLAGLAAGFLMYKPQLLLGLALWWLFGVRRYWPCLFGASVTAILFALVSFLFVADETAAWVNHLPEIARYDAFDFYNLHNPRGFGVLLTGNKSFGNWVGIVGLAVTVLWFFRFWRRHGSDLALMFSAAVFATLIGSPHTMTYEWALAVIPAALIWQRRPDLHEALLPLFAAAWIALFVSTPLTKGQIDRIGVAIQISVPVIVGIAVLIHEMLNRQPRNQASTSLERESGRA